jgi:hypothetical protein
MPKTRRFLAVFCVLLSVLPWPAADQNVGMACFVNKTPFYRQERPFYRQERPFYRQERRFRKNKTKNPNKCSILFKIP